MKKIIIGISLCIIAVIAGYIFTQKNSLIKGNDGTNGTGVISESGNTIISSSGTNEASGTAFLSEINSKVIEEDKKKSELNQQQTTEFSKILNEYTQDINANNDILKYISQESIKRIKERTKNVYNNFKTDEKKLFLKDLYDIGYDIKSFSVEDDSALNKYIDFLVKYNIKLQGKIVEVSDIVGKYDETTGIFCGTFDYTFDTKNKLKIESLCIDNDKKFLIHSI